MGLPDYQVDRGTREIFLIQYNPQSEDCVADINKQETCIFRVFMVCPHFQVNPIEVLETAWVLSVVGLIITSMV